MIESLENIKRTDYIKQLDATVVESCKNQGIR